MANGKELRSNRDLIAWQRAMDMVELVYTATQSWPREELYGLTSQVRRAAGSVPSNIAEGQGRSGSKEFLHHLSIARGSLAELETQAGIGQRLGYVNKERTDRILAATTKSAAYAVAYLVLSATIKLTTSD